MNLMKFIIFYHFEHLFTWDICAFKKNSTMKISLIFGSIFIAIFIAETFADDDSLLKEWEMFLVGT